MSLDDAAPTEYFGADAEVWDSPDGRTLQLSPAKGQRAATYGWTRNEEKQPIIFGPDVEDTGHREGCAFGRTARCTCMYLIQWDKTPAYTAPTFSAEPLGRTPMEEAGQILDQKIDQMNRLDGPTPDWPVAYTLFDDKGEAEKLFKDPGHLQPAPFPMEERDYYPQVEKPLKALTVDGQIWEPRRLRLDEELRSKYWHKEWLSLRRSYWWALGFAAFNGACLAVAVWQLVNR